MTAFRFGCHGAYVLLIASLLGGCGGGTVSGPSIRGPLPATTAPRTPTPGPSSSTPASSPSPSAAPSPTASSSPPPTTSPTATPAPTPTPTAAPQNIYVVNYGNTQTFDTSGSITGYALGSSGTQNATPGAVIIGSATTINAPTAIAVDLSGRIYATQYAGGAYAVNVFAANPSGVLNEAPIATIAGSNTQLNVPQGIAVDASGRVYVANAEEEMLVGGTPIVVMPASITVYAANPSGLLNEAPVATIAGSLTNVTDPFGLAVDAQGNVYVADADGFVFIFAPIPAGGGLLNEAPIATIAGSLTGLQSPRGVAVDANGNIYVSDDEGANFGSIRIFAPHPAGSVNETPAAVISGTQTQLDGPDGIALDASGNIYVADPHNEAVYEFGAGPAGAVNEAPLATISGNATRLNAPFGVAIGATSPAGSIPRAFRRR